MTNLERVEMHRDKVEIELKNLSKFKDSKEIKAKALELQKELLKAKDEVTIAVHFESFKFLNRRELKSLIKSETVDWKIKNAALDVSAWKKERGSQL